MRTLAVLLLAAGVSTAVSFQEYVQINGVSDSLTYGDGIRKDVLAGIRADGSSWNMKFDANWVTAGDGALLERYHGNVLQTHLESRIRLGNFTINPEMGFDLYIDSALIVLPRSEGEGYRNSALRPALYLSYAVPGLYEVRGMGAYRVRDVAALGSDLDTEWSEVLYGGNALWHTPLGMWVSLGGVSQTTTLDGTGFDASWSRVDIAAGYRPLRLPARTFVFAEAGISMYTGEDYTGMGLPDRFTARLRAVHDVTRNLTCNITFSQAADMYDGHTSLGPFQSAIRTRFKFSGWGDVPSSVMLGGQLTESSVTTRLGEIEGRISLYSGLSALVTGKLWYGPSSVAGTGGYRTREIAGGGLEYRMDNGLNTFVVYEREASNLAPNEIWNRVKAGIGFYPAPH